MNQPIVLVVDDETTICVLMTSMLQDEGFEVLTASDGREALELSRSRPGAIDLVISDIDMPRLKGTELCAHLLKERPGIKTILMTGGYANIASQDVKFPIVLKPFLWENLMTKVREALGVPAQRSKANPCQS